MGKFPFYNIEKNTHYDFTVTSGDVSADILKDKLLKTKDGKEYKNCYIFGKIQYQKFWMLLPQYHQSGRKSFHFQYYN